MVPLARQLQVDEPHSIGGIRFYVQGDFIVVIELVLMRGKVI